MRILRSGSAAIRASPSLDGGAKLRASTGVIMKRQDLDHPWRRNERRRAHVPSGSDRSSGGPGHRTGAWVGHRGGGCMRGSYLLAGQPSELERLRLQSRVWEPAGRQLLSQLAAGSGGRVLDVGCGALGWLRILSEWVGPSGRVVGADVDENLLDAAGSFLEAEGISNVDLVIDDL